MFDKCVSLVYNRFKEEPKMLQPRLVVKNHGTHGSRGTRNLQAKSTVGCGCGFSYSHNIMRCRHLKLLLFVLGIFAAPTFGAAQGNDEPNIIKPTPALRLASADDLTTVLLVNNDGAGRLGDGLGHGHGRFLSVRPEVGLLTSTARTFIQEGITTEYATQVVGTTLENGRLYAQYLKKSSRVLYEGGNGPSVVTSWVGDSVPSPQSRSYLESHNDLFNADAPNWRDIDDSLDDIASVPLVGQFVGNTDFLKLKDSSASLAVVVTPLVTKISKETSGLRPVAITEETARKLAAQKVLPVGDLPTFTVKNHFEPSGYQAIDDAAGNTDTDTDTSSEEEGRSAKVYYQHLMREKQSEQRSQQLLNLPKRVLSTVTYYGFADFTTIVGDSVIVFSPSTAQPSSIMGHVTSIKGMATLRTADLPVTDPVPEPDQVPVQIQISTDTDSETKESIQITNTPKTTAPEMILTTVLSTANAIDTTEVEVVSSSQSTQSEIINLISTATHTLDQTTSQSVAVSVSMFSLPTDEEIQKIYASLAKAQAKEQSSAPSIEATESTDLQGHSGATTIFIDDDPFANFIEPTRVMNDTVTATSNAIDLTTSQRETTTTTVVLTSEIEASTSTLRELSEESTVVAPSSVQVLRELTEESTLVAPSTLQISQFVREITSENTNDASCDEIRSQVFLTQVTQDSSTLEQTVSPSYDIKETTKYYCIQATEVKESTELKTASKTDSIVESQSESPQAEDEDITTVNPLEESQTEVATTEESLKTESTTETDAEDEDSTTELTETNQDNENDNDNDNDNENESDNDSENENENEDYDTEVGLDEIDVIYKTLYTTYTYLTTFFQGKSTTVSSHTEIVTNVITTELTSSQEAVSTKSSDIISATETVSIQATATVAPSKYIIPDDLDSLLHASANDATDSMDHGQETSRLDDAKYTKTFYTTYTYYTTIFADSDTEIMSRTEVFTNYVTELATTTEIEMPSDQLSVATVDRTATESTASISVKGDTEQHIRLVTDVRSSSSSGDQHQHLVGQLRDSVDDQVSSESNTEEILPSATLLLQTSFTTFTFYTTMYVSDATNVISRLETVTNIATETVQPTKMLSQEEATLPITYFTTFTYWTKLAKDGEITTISREETISNVIEPTKRAETETATVLSSITDSTAIDNLEKSIGSIMDSTTDLSALTTYYTTYTYYTTSYEANNTVTDSRLETITNIIRPTLLDSSSIASSAEEFTQTSLPVDISPSIPSREQSNTSDLIFYDYKHIIDAEGVSTLYFTTKIQASINDEGNRVELTSSTSSLYIDETKKLNLATSSASESVSDPNSRQYKTGLVRLIEGTRIGNSTTTLYQSKVIGTIIENRYAQIIESTSSFLFEKATPTSTISPSVTLDDVIVSTTQAVNLDSPPVVEGSINSDTSETETATEIEAEHEEHDDDDNNIGNNARIPFQSKKRTFAPVIRPFASRNRPTFAPKQKTASASSATIITRSDITPTITATPALKSVGRFGSSRRGSSSSSVSNAPNNPHETSSTSRRLFGRPLKTASGSISQLGSTLQVSSGISPSRNRFASTFRTSGIQASSSRRLSLGPSYRPSSSNIRVSALNSGISSRQRIKPTAASGSTFGKASTSAVGEETSTEEQQVETADEEDNTTETTKRNQNPLLRFRRPLGRPIGFTPAPGAAAAPRNGNGNASAGVTVSPRRNPFAGRAKASSTSTTTTTTTARPKPRSFQRPTISSVQARTRPQNALFPPRGLFQTQQQQKENEQSAVNNNQNENDSDNDSEYDDDDDDEDGAEEDATDDVQKEESRRRRSNKRVLTHSRVRRQADTLNRSRFRFRRPKTATTEEPKIEEINETTSSAPRSKINSRFGSRFQSQSSSGQTSSTEASSSPSGHRSIRPTRPTSPRTQFTLREKDTTIKSITRPSSSNFRRQQPALRRTGSSPTSSSRRLKSYTNHNHNHNAVESPGLRTTGTSRSRNTGNGSNRGRASMRGRNRNDYNQDPNLTDLGSATITVTHIIPAEVTVPVVNGQVTEYKNIVTGKTSLEVLGPNQYTRMLGNNGQTSLYLTREDSSVSPAGVTELTRYLLHDSPTTTVTFTPTTIRGRKTSFSHILPSTVYAVENVVSTVQPQISANAPLANILLSQLLLGNINLPANQLLGALGQPQPLAQGGVALEPSQPQPAAQPQTEYRTHTSTYVTTIYDGKSTILPITFQGKKILTTVFDTTAQTITATEYSVDTIINTPTQQPQLQGVQGQGQVNSLLLQQLLLQQQQQQQQQIPQVSHTTMPQIFLGENLQDLDDQLMDADIEVRDNIDDIIVSDIEVNKSSGRKKPRKSGKSHKRNKQQQQRQQPKQEEDSSVITLYVSGRRPGEFSTILSTVYPQDHSSSLHKRQVVQPTTTAELNGPEDLYEFGGSEKINLYSLLPLDNVQQEQEEPLMKNANECQESGCELKSRTASLESIIGDVDLWYAKATKQAKMPSTALHMITETNNLQVTTNLSTTHPPSRSGPRSKRVATHMPRLRKVLVRRKPISGYPTLVNDNTNNNTTNSNNYKKMHDLNSQPKKHRVVVFKYRSARRMKSSTAESTTFSTPKLTTTATLTTTPIQRSLQITTLKNNTQHATDHDQARFYLLTTTSTQLSTRTYTYVVERVHNDQHETLQSFSTFTRVNTRLLPITLTVAKSQIYETAFISTQIHSETQLN